MILYECDRRRCDNCDPICGHTTDISHARNYIKDPYGDYWELPREINEYMKMMQKIEATNVMGNVLNIQEDNDGRRKK